MKTKKLFLTLIMFLLAFSVSAKPKKPKKVFHYGIEVVSDVSERGKQISFNCFCYDMSMTWVKNFQITNNLDERISIEWENARFANSKVVFGDDSKLTMRNPKADEVITAKGNSIQRDITGLDRIDGNAQSWFLFPYNELKKNPGEKGTLDLIIPIKYSDNSVEDLKVQISVWYTLLEPTE